MKKTISVVVPCYNEKDALPIYYNTAMPIFEKIDVNIELVLVDDGSKDATSSIMKSLADSDSRVKYVIFSRNFGKEAAMFAGLEAASGDYVAVMDVDLQDPPEKLQEMFETLESGDFDCVATRRVTRKGEPKIRSWFARKFYQLINKWSQTEVVDGARDYRLMRREMVDAILSLKEVNRFSKGIFSWVGFKTKWLEYENIERVAGETKWNFKKLFAYAIEGIVAFTLAPLYMIVKFGVGLMIVDLLATIAMVVLHFIPAVAFSFDPLLIALCVAVFLVSILIICLGIMAIYQAKTYSEVKNRPIYIKSESNVK